MEPHSLSSNDKFTADEIRDVTSRKWKPNDLRQIRHKAALSISVNPGKPGEPTRYPLLAIYEIALLSALMDRGLSLYQAACVIKYRLMLAAIDRFKVTGQAVDPGLWFTGASNWENTLHDFRDRDAATPWFWAFRAMPDSEGSALHAPVVIRGEVRIADALAMLAKQWEGGDPANGFHTIGMNPTALTAFNVTEVLIRVDEVLLSVIAGREG